MEVRGTADFSFWDKLTRYVGMQVATDRNEGTQHLILAVVQHEIGRQTCVHAVYNTREWLDTQG